MPVRVDEALGHIAVPEFLQPREISSQLHTHLRRLIIDGAIAPGSELNQADLSRRFKVSRIPMREAFRMLQQEGLIDVQLNQRATVRGLDAAEIDSLYGVRIALEALGARITAGRLSSEEAQSAEHCLVRMREALSADDMAEWIAVHRQFHAICTARADEPLARIIMSYSERSERYLRFAQLSHPDRFTSAEHDHQQILAVLVDGEAETAGSLMAHHLSHTAMRVLADLDAGADRTTVAQSLEMSAGRRPVKSGPGRRQEAR